MENNIPTLYILELGSFVVKHENKDFKECIHQKCWTFTNFTIRHTAANFP